MPHTSACQPRNLAQSPGQCTYNRDDQANNPEDNRTSAVVCHGIHHGGESQNMTTHNEHKKEKLARSQKLSAEARQSNSTKQYFSCICHAVHLGISQFELAYHI